MGKVIVKKDTPHQCFARLELNNGDQVMISVVQAEVKVTKMNWAGMLPGPNPLEIRKRRRDSPKVLR